MERERSDDVDDDVLWDPDLRRRQVLEMTMSERLELMHVLMKQAALVAEAVRVR